MAATPYHVAEAFIRREYARSGHFHSSGDAIYSYAMKLAHWEGDRYVFDYQRKDEGGKAPSTTTSRHMTALEAVA